MAIDIRFDLVGNPEPPTIILANRNGNKLGQLEINEDSINLSDKFNDASEFTFTLNKFINNRVTNLWDNVVDFKLVYCKEWDMWFEISVELDESTESVKTVSCVQLGQAELSQIKLYDIEINTENDIARDDYKISILYDKRNPDSSILNRLFEKAPHYSIGYVSPTIEKIQRSFSFSDTSIYDACQEIAEEIGCFFDFPSNSDASGKIQRIVSVYDLQQNCNDCGYRGEYTDVCPKCGSTNIKYGYGEDTLIFVTADELASNGIQLTADADSTKNCFKLEAGDNLMTATVRNCNPNGTDYIWRFSDDMKSDMSKELVDKLNTYDELYKYYHTEHISDIDNDLIDNYNKLVDKYDDDNKSLEMIMTPICGHSALMNSYYNTVDFALYLQSVLVPKPYDSYLTDELDNFLVDESDNYMMYKVVDPIETTAIEQAALLTTKSLSPVSVSNLSSVSLSTLDSTMLSMAKIIIKPTYKVQVKSSEMIDDDNIKTWKGNFVVTNYSDDEDSAVSEIISVVVNDDYELFVKQKIEKILSKENTDSLSITSLFSKDYSDFCDDISRYALNPLVSFREACQACIDILIEQGIGNNNTWSDTTAGSDGNLYEKLYKPYYDKLLAIESEIKIRESEINLILGVYDTNGFLSEDGMQSAIVKCKNKIQEVLDFKTYLGNELWLEFCSYRREDKYSNDNYISDGLNNTELFEKAKEFFEVANNEIFKSSELQYSISTTLNNLLAIPKFKLLVKSFKTGNWIRIRVDGKIYKLRLLEYEIDYGDFNDVSVEFSEATRIKNGITDVESILSQASSIASSYNSVQRQANQGEKSSEVLNEWFESGLNATNTKIVSTDNQNQIWDRNGILCRQYDPITETYSDEQLKIVNSTIAITDNNWKTTKTAIGKYYYTDPSTKELKSTYGVNGETIVGKLLLGEMLDISNENGNLQFGENGLVVANDVNSVSINPNSESIFNISNDSGVIFSLNEDGQLVLTGNITASSLNLLDGVEIGTNNVSGLSNVALSGSYNDLSDTPAKLSDFENDGVFITKDVDNLENYYKKTDVNNLLDKKANSDDLSEVATSGSYNDLIDITELKNWVLEQIALAINQQ